LTGSGSRFSSNISTQLDKKIKQIVNGYYKKNCSLYIDISENLGEILLNNKWKFDTVFKTRTIQKKLLDSGHRIETFKKFNRIPSDITEFPADFIALIKEAKEEALNKQAEGLETELFEFKSCDLAVTPDGSDGIKPKSIFDVFSYYTNLVVDNDIKYVYNNKVDVMKTVNDLNIYKIKLKVEAAVGQAVIPLHYKGYCHKKDKFGGICGNEILVGHHQLATTIKCNVSAKDKPDAESHTVNVSKLEPIYRMYYIYLCTYKNDTGKEIEHTFYSMYPIEDAIVNANCINCSFGSSATKSSYTVILSTVKSESDLITIKKNIIDTETHTRSYLHSIFKNIQTYYKKYHGIEMTNKNRYIAFVILTQLINNKYNDHIQNAQIWGSSGSGKSYYAVMLPHLFTPKTGYYNGMTISRVGFIGGQDSVNGVKIFRSGAISKDDLSIVEEGARPLDGYHDPSNMRSFNIYESIKTLNPDMPIDIGIQGSKPVDWRSSLIFIGNMEGLESTKNYKSLVRREYKKLSGGKKFNNNLPVFANMKYYKDNSEALARAHKLVRDDILGDVNFLTRLPSAEQSRFDFCVYLIPDNKNIKHALPSNTKNMLVHRANFIKELDDIFRYDEKLKPSVTLIDSVHEYLTTEYSKQNNNYDLKNSTQHVYNRVFYNALYHTFNGRVYFNAELECALNEDEKLEISTWLRYNYNLLDTAEASYLARPEFNNTDVIVENIEELKEISSDKVSKYYSDKRKEEFKSGLMPEDSIFDGEKN